MVAGNSHLILKVEVSVRLTSLSLLVRNQLFQKQRNFFLQWSKFTYLTIILGSPTDCMAGNDLVLGGGVVLQAVELYNRVTRVPSEKLFGAGPSFKYKFKPNLKWLCFCSNS